MSLNGDAGYTATQQYSTIPKSSHPPNVVHMFDPIPPPNHSETVIVDNNRFCQANYQFADGDFTPPDFFSRANLDGFTRRFNSGQWNYEMRRDAQLVLPFMALGPISALRDRDTLRERGFTLLLGIRNTHSAHARLVSGQKAADELGIQADTIDVLDGQELISSFPRAIRRINDHLAGMDGAVNANNAPNGNISASEPARKKVLIFCESGNDRSAAVAVAYIMVMMNKDAPTATRMVQDNRYCVSIDDSMRSILFSFEAILKAKRDVECTRRTSGPIEIPTLNLEPMSQFLNRKRSFLDREEEDAKADYADMDIDDEDDLDARKPLAPFEDRVLA